MFDSWLAALGVKIMAVDTPKKNEVQKEKIKKPLKTMLILLAVFLVEGGGISLFWVMKKGPKPAEATDPIQQTEQNPNKDFAEVVLAENFQVDNYVGGRSRLIVTLEVVAKVEAANKEKLEAAVKEHSKEILNEIRVLVASAQPEQIKDPKKQVITRELKAGIEKIVGEGLLKELLLPVWQAYSND